MSRIEFEIYDVEPSNDLTQISFPLLASITSIYKGCVGVKARIIYERSVLDAKLYELIVCVDCGKLINSRPC